MEVNKRYIHLDTQVIPRSVDLLLVLFKGRTECIFFLSDYKTFKAIMVQLALNRAHTVILVVIRIFKVFTRLCQQLQVF